MSLLKNDSSEDTSDDVADTLSHIKSSPPSNYIENENDVLANYVT